MEVTKSYHIGIDEKDIEGARYALLPGDPSRVELIASYLEDPKFIGQNREYTTWLGKLCGVPVVVMSTGIGGPSTAIAIEELNKLNVDTFIRVGTCGGMQLNVTSGDVVIATGSIRMDGTSVEYVPIEFPAVADFDVTAALVKAADDAGVKFHTGVVQSKDSFYGQHEPDKMPVSYELKNKWDAWIKAGCIASEMESATLFVISSFLRVRAGSLFHCVWNQERANAGFENEMKTDVNDTIKIAIDALKLLIEKDKEI